MSETLQPAEEPQQAETPQPSEPPQEREPVAVESSQQQDPVAAESPQQPGPVPAEAPATVAAPRDRRVLRAVLRWTAAVVVFGLVGAATAYGVTEQKRTDLPGLATESDGRWDFPAMEKPPLPDGSPAPFADGNDSETHYADLRKLVLPLPRGARPDRALAGKDGWLPTPAYLDAYEKDARQDLGQQLEDDGLRQIAARGWTTPDGTHTRIYALRFTSAAFTRIVHADLTDNVASPADAPYADEEYGGWAEKANVQYTKRNVFTEAKPYGRTAVRYAYIEAGDVIALVIQSGEAAKAGKSGEAGKAALPPRITFQQTVVLQSQLLG
ncbi:hypothetical protein ACGF0K_13840 [Streptomyces sp. NPDC048156]|uniref:hypothetical protein n=1 Tax=Streptomyces sp. NPDC048156 TaxID=3365502 RepID=UPI00371D6DDE